MRAAEALLDALPAGGRVRVGVISFSGEMNPQTGRRRRYDQEDAWLEVPLTADFQAVRARLPHILARGPYGGTNFAAGCAWPSRSWPDSPGRAVGRGPTRGTW